MRYYIDTNILIFILSDDKDELEDKIVDLLDDYSNLFLISTIALQELILLYKGKKLEHLNFKTYKEMLFTIEELNYEIIPITKKHLYVYAELETANDHKDPNDHVIIAQAISDKIPIISSDRKFKCYENQGLQLVFNKR